MTEYLNTGNKMENIKFSRELVLKKVRAIFSQEKHKEIIEILDLYGTGQYEHSIERVQLAILKICGGKEERVRELVKLAKIDFPEPIIWPAEEPNFHAVRNKTKLTQEEIQKLQEIDRKQYLGWLNDDGAQ